MPFWHCQRRAKRSTGERRESEWVFKEAGFEPESHCLCCKLINQGMNNGRYGSLDVNYMYQFIVLLIITLRRCGKESSPEAGWLRESHGVWSLRRSLPGSEGSKGTYPSDLLLAPRGIEGPARDSHGAPRDVEGPSSGTHRSRA